MSVWTKKLNLKPNSSTKISRSVYFSVPYSQFIRVKGVNMGTYHQVNVQPRKYYFETMQHVSIGSIRHK